MEEYTQPTSETIEKKSKTWIWILIVVILIAIGVGSYFLFADDKNPDVCTDSDGGENYQIKGSIDLPSNASQTPGEDSCQLSTYNENLGQWEYTDVEDCPPNTNNDAPNSNEDRCIVRELVCDSPGSYQFKSKYCPNGCDAGACDIVEELV
ncbi:hypothetical protein HOA55_04905 [archaeon]|jgi:hypothetical protein|nr:hypothetical protein [archaeon]MBT3578119.1 hypothetical protein [archaeon]MBT6820667.1 hypothetical protein [archaeon]MBT6955688.1 hypothetical protein [archaeon]MBT7024923.1 hypothetical protein [archaeon]